MNDWLLNLIAGIGDALGSSLENAGELLSGAIWDTMLHWFYTTIYGAIGEFFASMGNLGAEIFSLGWVLAVVRLFSLLGWALYATGVAVAVFDVAIEYQSGKATIKTTALNVLKGFFACSLLGTLPVSLYQFCVSLQSVFTRDLAGAMADAQGETLAELSNFVLQGMFAIETGIQCTLFNLLELIAFAYVNTRNVTGYGSSGNGVYLSANGVSSPAVRHNTTSSSDNGWMHIFVTFHNTTSTSVQLAVCCSGVKGTVYIDDAQLEEGGVMSAADILQNGNLSNTNAVIWDITNGSVGNATQPNGSNGSVLVMQSTPDRSANACQTVPIYLSGKTSFVFSGWARAKSVPDNTTDNTKKFGLKAVITYSDGATETHYRPFCSDVTDWQYLSLMIVPRQPGKTINTITACCIYDYNNRIAYFDDLSLIQETANTYTYDENGNLTKVGTTSAADVNYSYNGANDLASFTSRNGVRYDYTYGSYHNVTKITDGTADTDLTYDSMGNVTRITVSPADSASPSIVTNASYTAGSKNSRLSSVRNANGYLTSYYYATAISEQYGTPTAVITPDGTTTTTGYDAHNNRVVTAAVENLVRLQYAYDKGRMNSIQRITPSKTQTYNLTYSTFGDLAGVAVGTQQLASSVYHIRTGVVMSMTYGNGDKVEYSYNGLDQVTEAAYNGSTRFTYQYTGDGQLARVTDTVLNRTDTYTYDSLGRQIYRDSVQGGGLLLYTANTYDTGSRLTRHSYGGSGLSTRSHLFSYSASHGLLTSETMLDGTVLNYSYDALERQTLAAGSVYSRYCSYAAPGGSGSGTTTALVSNMNYKHDGNVVRTFNYTYDNMGRIASDGTYTYTYDALGQLTTVKNSSGTTVASYTYDNAGNILTATENGTTVSYTYGNSSWADLLTAYNGQAITYDAIGNPTSYRGWTMGWQNGRQLASASKGSTSLSYVYGPDGLRTNKTVNGAVHNYVYDGGKLVLEKSGQVWMEFLYDASGAPYSVRYSTNGGASFVPYYYLLNPQGDVVALVDSSCNMVGIYVYDAWGKITAVKDAGGNAITSSTHIANVNPIRYRGYYYDTESSLYYLQSRYYDPEVGRFINADSYASTGQGVIGFNMFAYCGNNPMSYCDPNGNTYIRSGYKKFGSGLIAYTDTGSGCMIQTSISAQVFQPYDKFAGYAEKHGDYYHYAMYAGVNGPNLSEGAILAAAAAGLGVIGADYEHSSWQIETVTADAKIGASLDYIGFQAGARLVSGETGLKFPLPFTDRELYVGLEGELFGVGAHSYVQDGKLRIGVTLLVGGGVIIGISDE